MDTFAVVFDPDVCPEKLFAKYPIQVEVTKPQKPVIDFPVTCKGKNDSVIIVSGHAIKGLLRWMFNKGEILEWARVEYQPALETYLYP